MFQLPYLSFRLHTVEETHHSVLKEGNKVLKQQISHSLNIPITKVGAQCGIYWQVNCGHYFVYYLCGFAWVDNGNGFTYLCGDPTQTSYPVSVVPFANETCR